MRGDIIDKGKAWWYTFPISIKIKSKGEETYEELFKSSKSKFYGYGVRSVSWDRDQSGSGARQSCRS